jgi:hypothetical protein
MKRRIEDVTNPGQNTFKCKVFDEDTGKEIEHVTYANESTGEITRYESPFIIVNDDLVTVNEVRNIRIER